MTTQRPGWVTARRVGEVGRARLARRAARRRRRRERAAGPAAGARRPGRRGRVVIGVTGVRAQLQRDALSCVVLAADASVRTREKVERLARARRVPVLVGPVAERLGAGLGRPPVQAVGVADAALARGLVGSLEE